MQTRIAGISHIGTHGMGKTHAALFELMRGHRERAALHALELVNVTREHDLPMFHAFTVFLEGWAASQSGAPPQGLEGMRRGVELLRERNALHFDGLLKIALAEAEARAGDADRAIAILDEALARAERLGYRAFEAELHRTRGEILLTRDPTNPAPAEEAFRTALAIAKQQGARSWCLRAALSLAKLYQSTSRLAEAQAVLAPALEGFTPTPEMPEIAEAQALLAALAGTEEVKADAARRQRLTHLRVAYGNALYSARGFGAPETTEVFAKARESSSGNGDSPGRLSVDYGLWVGCFTRGDLASMRTHAAAFLSDIEAIPDSPEASVAHRAAGVTRWFAGDYREAQDHLERALAQFQTGRDDDLAFRFGVDPGAAAMVYLAFASWPLGEVDRAISLIDRMQTRIEHFTHVGTLAFALGYATFFEMMRGRPCARFAARLRTCPPRART
jgi:tetratricopeptide (TPR) repeat protein